MIMKKPLLLLEILDVTVCLLILLGDLFE